MPSTFTTNIGLNKPAQGDTPWDTAVNGNMDAIDQCFSGTKAIIAGQYTEGAAVGAAAGKDVLYADSTAHAFKLSNNGDAFQNVARGQLAFLTSVYTNNTTVASNIPGLSFPVAANTNYVIEFNCFYQGSAGTAGLDITVTGPAAPTTIIYSYIEDATSTGGSQDSVATAFGTKLTGAGNITVATNLPGVVKIALRNGANAGTVQLQGSASGAGTVTVQPGSYGRLTQA